MPESDDVDELSRLGASFNRMLDDVSSSREQLVQANRQLDARREFTEAVLGGVSSGVIGLDRRGKITLPNRRPVSFWGKVLMNSMVGNSQRLACICAFI